jgi:hypothetical protein
MHHVFDIEMRKQPVDGRGFCCVLRLPKVCSSPVGIINGNSNVAVFVFPG